MTTAILVATLSTICLLGIGGWLTEIGPWYQALRKPRLQPPGWIFGPAWTVILSLAAGAGVLAWEGAPDAAARMRILALFALNGILHILWSPLFFKVKRPDWALMEMPLLWLSVLALMVGVAPYTPIGPWLLLPYLAWVAFAMWINFGIVRLNGPFR